MAQRCKECGQPVEFRFIDGRCIPLHTSGGCSNPGSGTGAVSIKRRSEGECRKTSCPKCGEVVYFIKHNGGSVWIEPPLGPPWDVHGCFAHEPGKIRAAPIDPEILRLLGQRDNAVTGVVASCEVGNSRRESILEIAIGDDEVLVIMVKGGADALLGEIMVIELQKRLLYLMSDHRICFRIIASMGGPERLIGLDRPLHMPINWNGFGQARGGNRATELTKRQRRALRRYREVGLKQDWNLSDLLCLIPLITGRDKERAVHWAALAVIKHAEKCGDCSRAADLARITSGLLGSRFEDWLWRHSPIKISRSSKGLRAFIFRSVDGQTRPFLIDQARRNPI